MMVIFMRTRYQLEINHWMHLMFFYATILAKMSIIHFIWFAFASIEKMMKKMFLSRDYRVVVPNDYLYIFGCNTWRLTIIVCKSVTVDFCWLQYLNNTRTPANPKYKNIVICVDVPISFRNTFAFVSFLCHSLHRSQRLLDWITHG